MKRSWARDLERNGRRFGLAGFLALAVGGCATGSREPRNLQLAKRDVAAYVESGAYDEELKAVAKSATAWLEERASRGGGKLAIVFDVDETLLRNWPQIRGEDFGYIPARWDNWVHETKAPAIEPVCDVFRAAKRLGIEVVLLTGRPERHRAPTTINLRTVGLGDFALMVCRPDGDRRSNADFKTEARRRLTEAGYVIVANIGDQVSDLVGGNAERTFKVPNPFYLSE